MKLEGSDSKIGPDIGIVPIGREDDQSEDGGMRLRFSGGHSEADQEVPIATATSVGASLRRAVESVPGLPDFRDDDQGFPFPAYPGDSC